MMMLDGGGSGDGGFRDNLQGSMDGGSGADAAKEKSYSR
jgi:hypothetical protein